MTNDSATAIPDKPYSNYGIYGIALLSPAIRGDEKRRGERGGRERRVTSLIVLHLVKHPVRTSREERGSGERRLTSLPAFHVVKHPVRTSWKRGLPGTSLGPRRSAYWYGTGLNLVGECGLNDVAGLVDLGLHLVKTWWERRGERGCGKRRLTLVALHPGKHPVRPGWRTWFPTRWLASLTVLPSRKNLVGTSWGERGSGETSFGPRCPARILGSTQLEPGWGTRFSTT